MLYGAKKLSYIYSSTPSFIDLDSLNNIVIVGSYQYSGGGGLTNVFIEKLDSAGNSLFQTIITGQNNNMTWNPFIVSFNRSGAIMSPAFLKVVQL